MCCGEGVLRKPPRTHTAISLQNTVHCTAHQLNGFTQVAGGCACFVFERSRTITFTLIVQSGAHCRKASGGLSRYGSLMSVMCTPSPRATRPMRGPWGGTLLCKRSMM
jgi:hypothetical protein